MESEGVSVSTTAAPPKSHLKLIAVIAILAVSVAVGALLASAFISKPHGQKAWLFKGAYAIYKGSTSFSSEDIGMLELGMSMSIDFTLKIEIVDFNETHALVSTSYQMSSSGEFGGAPEEDEKTEWVLLSEMGLFSLFEDVDLNNSYESNVNIESFGTRTCMIYEYAISEEGLTMTVYVDKTIEWPLKMVVGITNTELLGLDLRLEINLMETNIPALG